MLFSLGFAGALAAALRDQADLAVMLAGLALVSFRCLAVPIERCRLFRRHVGLPVDHAASLLAARASAISLATARL